MSKSNEQIIRATEIGEHVFCHRAWWLHHVQGLESANRPQMDAGTNKHNEHGRAVQHADHLRRWAIVLFAIALFFALLFRLATILPSM